MMLDLDVIPATMLTFILAIPFVVNVGTMALDEFVFHWERGLPRWERIGHPLDTFTVLICYAFLLTAVRDRESLLTFMGLALFSLLFAAKDEPIHRRLCRREEHITHLTLFVLHPLVLGSAGLVWWYEPPGARLLLQVQGILTALFMFYQIVFWNLMVSSRGFGHDTGQARNQ